jgi:5-methylcytosine-specific restriction endonuclease McrA
MINNIYNMNYERKAIYTVGEVLSKQIDPTGNISFKDKSKDKLVEFDGDMISMVSHRYWLFKHKGCKCVKCGLEGVYFAKEKDRNAKRYHFNLYGLRNGVEVMITKDHIIPKSKGGKHHLSNYQTMCYDCNHEKGDKL